MVHLAPLLASRGFRDHRRGGPEAAAIVSCPCWAGSPRMRSRMPCGGNGTSSRSSPALPRMRRRRRPGPAMTRRSTRWRSVSRPRRPSWPGRVSKVTARTVKRKRQRYQVRGLAGLVDWRANRAGPVGGRTDERVVQALQQAIGEQAAGSTRTASFYLWRTRQILAGRYGAERGPICRPQATFYRLFERVTAGLHTTGSARTRQSLANRPERPFGHWPPAARARWWRSTPPRSMSWCCWMTGSEPGRADRHG